jgi:hypothetical protein
MNNKENDLDVLHDQVAGHLASSWLPSGIIRKIILFVFVVLAVKFLLDDSYTLTVLMLILASFFSPRAMGELVHFIGSMVGRSKR